MIADERNMHEIPTRYKVGSVESEVASCVVLAAMHSSGDAEELRRDGLQLFADLHGVAHDSYPSALLVAMGTAIEIRPPKESQI